MRRTTLTLAVCLSLLTAAAKSVTSRITIGTEAVKQKIELAAKKVPGVTAATYSPTARILTVTFDNKKTNTTKIRAAIQKAGYPIGGSPMRQTTADKLKKSRNNP